MQIVAAFFRNRPRKKRGKGGEGGARRKHHLYHLYRFFSGHFEKLPFEPHRHQQPTPTWHFSQPARKKRGRAVKEVMGKRKMGKHPPPLPPFPAFFRPPRKTVTGNAQTPPSPPLPPFSRQTEENVVAPCADCDTQDGATSSPRRLVMVFLLCKVPIKIMQISPCSNS